MLTAVLDKFQRQENLECKELVFLKQSGTFFMRTTYERRQAGGVGVGVAHAPFLLSTVFHARNWKML